MLKPRMSMALIAAFLALGLSSAIAKPPKVVMRVSVDKHFIKYALTWDGGFGGYRFLWDVRAIKGKIASCGVGYYEDISSMNQSEGVMRKAYVKYNDKKILKDLRFFARVKSRSALKKATANCASTGVPVPRGRYHVELGWDAGRAGF